MKKSMTAVANVTLVLSFVSPSLAQAVSWTCRTLDQIETQELNKFEKPALVRSVPGYDMPITGLLNGATAGTPQPTTEKGAYFSGSGWKQSTPNLLEGVSFWDVTHGDPAQAEKSAVLCKKVFDRAFEAGTGTVTFTSICKQHPSSVYPDKVVNSPTIQSCKLNGEVPADLLAQARQEMQAARDAAAAASATTETPNETSGSSGAGGGGSRFRSTPISKPNGKPVRR